MDEQWMLISQAAQLLGVNKQRITQLLLSGKLEGKHFGKFWIVSRKSVEARAKHLPELQAAWRKGQKTLRRRFQEGRR